MENFFKGYFIHFSEAIRDIKAADIQLIIKEILIASKKKKKIIIAGNGGSAAISSHVSVDLTKTAKIESINFNESDLITCFANDYGYENWVAKALEAYAKKGDVCIFISSSGMSRNIINACKVAKKLKLKIITFTGFDKNNYVKSLGDINIWVNSEKYNIIEMSHLYLLLMIIDKIILDKKKK